MVQAVLADVERHQTGGCPVGRLTTRRYPAWAYDAQLWREHIEALIWGTW
jgi:hypothetical protein